MWERERELEALGEKVREFELGPKKVYRIVYRLISII